MSVAAQRQFVAPADTVRPGRQVEKPATPVAAADTVWRLGVAAAVLAAIYLRAPSILNHPRFWAEEGSLFFREAYGSSFWESIFFVPQNTAGYFLLCANLPIAIAAHLLPLKFAPAVTTYFSLLIQLMPFAVILWGKSLVWESKLQKTLACAALLLAATASGEAWLNSINAQVYCGIISLVLLGEDLRDASNKKLILYGLIQAFCALSGVYSTFLFFAFVLKAYGAPIRGNLIQALVSLIFALVQAGVFLTLHFSQHISHKKFSAEFPWAEVIPNAFYFHFALPIVGHEYAGKVASLVGFSPSQVHSLPTSEQRVVIFLCAFTMLLVLGLILLLKKTPLRSALLVGFLTATLLTTVSSVGATPGGRYAVFPGAYMLLLLLAEEPKHLKRILTYCFFGVVTFSLWQGARSFYHLQNYWDCHSVCPVWEDELAKWESDHSYLPQVWPIHANKPEVKWLIRLEKSN